MAHDHSAPPMRLAGPEREVVSTDIACSNTIISSRRAWSPTSDKSAVNGASSESVFFPGAGPGNRAKERERPSVHQESASFDTQILFRVAGSIILIEKNIAISIDGNTNRTFAGSSFPPNQNT
jgi:hypothetical protein